MVTTAKYKEKFTESKLYEYKFKKITGECRHKIYYNTNDPCARCAFCTVDGNDYSEIKEKPPAVLS